MDKTDRLRDYGLAFLLYEQGLGICGYELIRELFIFTKLILNSYLLASNTVTALDMSLWKVRIQIFRGLHIGILLLRHLGIKEVEDKVGCSEQWEIDNRR